MNASAGFSFVVGVTGHRDLNVANRKALAEQISRVLGELQQRMPGVPIEVATGLADGADREVALVALEMGMPVRAVLPMPKDMYLSDFAPESLTEFEKLLSMPGVTAEEIPLPGDLSPGDISPGSGERDRLYGRLGDYLTRRSNLLVALWDGGTERLEGGTADVVMSYLQGREQEAVAAQQELEFIKQGRPPPGANVVAWVTVGRSTDRQTVTPAVCYLVAGDRPGQVLKFPEMPTVLIDRVEALNDHFLQFDRLVAAGGTKNDYCLLDGLPEQPPEDLRHVLARIDAEYQRADALALENQRRSDRIFKLFGLMAGAMGLFFLLYAKIAALKVFLVIYLALFAGGYLLFQIAHKRHWFARHLSHRVVAETMRVYFYMVCAGVTDRMDVRRLVSLTGIENFSGFSWLHDVLRIGEPLVPEQMEAGFDATQVVQKAWIDDQLAYFNRKIHLLSHGHHRLEKIKTSLFALSFLGVVGLLLFKYQLTSIELAAHLDLKTLLVFFMGLLPLWLGIWEIYQNKMAMRELLWQYRNQANHFARAAQQIDADSSLDQKKRILVELGERSLFETYLWTIHRFHREQEPPSAG